MTGSTERILSFPTISLHSSICWCRVGSRHLGMILLLREFFFPRREKKIVEPPILPPFCELLHFCIQMQLIPLQTGTTPGGNAVNNQKGNS